MVDNAENLAKAEVDGIHYSPFALKSSNFITEIIKLMKYDLPSCFSPS